jgi:hypothetical protein
VILYGAFDRHNFGDLLLAHVCAAQLPGRPIAYAGLAARDLRRCGGHRVEALPAAAREAKAGTTVLHVGGEVLTTSAWEAAVMLLPPREVPATVAYLEAHPQERREWVRSRLGTADLAPYLAPREWLPPDAIVHCHAVGGFDLDTRDPALRAEVMDKLRRAHSVSVRDRATLAHLASAGVAASLVPDAAVKVAWLFAPKVARRANAGEVARVRATFPRGFFAVQCGAEYGDDATLDALAAQLDAAAEAAGVGIALFRAGAAPWHDDLAVLRRLRRRLHRPAVVFVSLDIWDLCALIASSRACCCSSLHARIVAMAFAVPRVGLRADPGDGLTKHEAFARTWEPAGLMPPCTPAAGVADALHRALSADPAALRDLAASLAALHQPPKIEGR